MLRHDLSPDVRSGYDVLPFHSNCGRACATAEASHCVSLELLTVHLNTTNNHVHSKSSLISRIFTPSPTFKFHHNAVHGNARDGVIEQQAAVAKLQQWQPSDAIPVPHSLLLPIYPMQRRSSIRGFARGRQTRASSWWSSSRELSIAIGREQQPCRSVHASRSGHILTSCRGQLRFRPIRG